MIADDVLGRLGLSDLLDGDEGYRGRRRSLRWLEAVERAAARAIDVALVDVRMLRMDGIAAIPRALASGADGFLLKDTDPTEIQRVVHFVASGSAMLSPTAARRLADRYHRTNQPQTITARARIAPLTPRESGVLALLARGDANAEIAQRLGMRESTAKTHVSRILSALQVSNRVQAALLSRDAGLTP
ncbi:LuxR C-terminal-related transcriptional regulator [Streptomyces sp. MBT42]|uniref:LuxR C-terminal-related transcriptional regulator n=1 Tax=Streptomyces sp. MBT42 TaxID=1488373 RepID=UPI0035A94BC2